MDKRKYNKLCTSSSAENTPIPGRKNNDDNKANTVNTQTNFDEYYGDEDDDDYTDSDDDSWGKKAHKNWKLELY